MASTLIELLLYEIDHLLYLHDTAPPPHAEELARHYQKHGDITVLSPGLTAEVRQAMLKVGPAKVKPHLPRAPARSFREMASPRSQQAGAVKAPPAGSVSVSELWVFEQMENLPSIKPLQEWLNSWPKDDRLRVAWRKLVLPEATASSTQHSILADILCSIGCLYPLGRPSGKAIRSFAGLCDPHNVAPEGPVLSASFLCRAGRYAMGANCFEMIAHIYQRVGLLPLAASSPGGGLGWASGWASGWEAMHYTPHTWDDRTALRSVDSAMLSMSSMSSTGGGARLEPSIDIKC